MWGIRTILNPWGAPGNRAFDNLAEGNNAAESIIPPEPETPDVSIPIAEAIDQVLAGA